MIAKHNGISNVEPEARVQQALWAALLAPIGLFIFAWTAPFDVHWVAPLIGVTVFCVGTGVIFTSFIPYLAVYAGPEAPLAMAISTVTRSGE